MRAIVAYADFERFGVLPRAGGSFDQDADLMEDMRYVADVVRQTREAAAAERERDEGSLLRRAFRRGG